MALAADKKRLLINIPAFLGLQVQAAAELDRRSQSSWILKLIDDKLASLTEEEQDKLAILVTEKFEELPEKQKTAASVEYLKYMSDKFPELLK